MHLKQLHDDIWTAESELREPGLRLPVRMTVIRIGSALFVHSPLELDDALANEVAALGRVAWLVAPNRFHHMSLRPWHDRWPNAELWAAPGLADKRQDLAFTGTLADTCPAAWRGHVAAVCIEGVPKVGEVVFFHAPSGAFLCTDLVFNIQNPRGWAAWPILKLMGTYKRFAMSSVWKLFTKDRVRLAASIERVLAWDITSVVMAHGEIVDADARCRLANALAWMRGGAREPPALRAAF